jgi:uncharacterized protein YidB (DUF937 family)
MGDTPSYDYAKRRYMALEEIEKTLKQNAVDCIFHVANGKALRRDLAEKFGLTEDEVSGLLAVEACKLVDHIRE